jgi:putative transposase
MQGAPDVSERRVCRVMGVPRSAVREREPKQRVPVVDEVLAARVERLIAQHPTFGYRRLWAMLRFREGLLINRKAVYRVLVVKGWFVHQRRTTPRPRVQGRRSRASRSNERWAMDVTHIDCGSDGWAHLAAVIDCHDRELVGYEFARRGRAKEAERALEAACIDRFGTLRPDGGTPVLRSDNGLIFQSRRFRAACKDYRLRQEFITPFCEVACLVNTAAFFSPSCWSPFCPRCESGPTSLRTFGFDSVGDAIYSNGSRLRPRRDSRSPTEELTTELLHRGTREGAKPAVFRPSVPEQSPARRATSRRESRQSCAPTLRPQCVCHDGPRCVSPSRAAERRLATELEGRSRPLRPEGPASGSSPPS